MPGVKLFVATVDAESPAAVAIALIVMFEEIKIGAWYTCDDVVGVEPSSV
jgi:hypothetical protein